MDRDSILNSIVSPKNSVGDINLYFIDIENEEGAEIIKLESSNIDHGIFVVFLPKNKSIHVAANTEFGHIQYKLPKRLASNIPPWGGGRYLSDDNGFSLYFNESSYSKIKDFLEKHGAEIEEQAND